MADLPRRTMLSGLAAVALTAPIRLAQAQTTTADTSQLAPEQRESYEAIRKRMMAALPYECITVSGEQALAEWERLRASGRGWPVVVGNDDDLERIADQFSMDDPNVSGVSIPGMQPRSPAEILAAAEHITFPADLRQWQGAYQPDDLLAPVGDWPSEIDTSSPGLSVANDLVSGRTHDEVHILLTPAKSGWEVPAYLRWGDWNACPPPEYHVAALRRWHEQYDADLIGINGDTMNIRTARSPDTRNDAMALAREQYGYCPDIVDQGVGSISALAAALMASKWWFFWWD